ncbi:MAG: hypothetical protein ACFB0G_01940 [Leptolyngbyaceae cyanobacterium]
MGLIFKPIAVKGTSFRQECDKSLGAQRSATSERLGASRFFLLSLSVGAGAGYSKLQFDQVNPKARNHSLMRLSTPTADFIHAAFRYSRHSTPHLHAGVSAP